MIGPVRQVNLNFDQSGRSKGTASVVFARKNDAVRSVEKLRNITLDGMFNFNCMTSLFKIILFNQSNFIFIIFIQYHRP
jgi:RNA recognition motif-containing protein